MKCRMKKFLNYGKVLNSFMQKILITGAAGFVVYHLSRSLLEDGYYSFKNMQAVDVLKTYVDIKKSSKILKFKLKVSLQDGLKRTIYWYKSFIRIK